MTEISNFQEVTSLLGINGVRVGAGEYKYPCPACGAVAFEANDVFGHCFKCDASFNYVSYFAEMNGVSNKEAYKEIITKTGHTPVRSFVPTKKTEDEPRLAPVKVRDMAYRTMLSYLRLSQKHRADLIARGLSDDRIKTVGYKTYFVGDYAEKRNLAAAVIKKVGTLKGVPGYSLDKKGNATFPKMSKEGILVPYLNREHEVQGLQIRRNTEDLSIREDGKRENKYIWFSSKDRPDGVGPRTFVHYAVDWNKWFKKGYSPILKKKILLTEGAMKADIVHFLSGEPVIAVPGVNSLSEFQKELPFLRESGVETIVCCYDMDYLTNESVRRAEKKMKIMVEKAGLSFSRLTWDKRYKGLDDYLHGTGDISLVK